MDIKVWRIAGIVCGICSLALLAFVIYNITWLENPNMRNEPLKVVLPLVMINTFVAGLITFPYYWFRAVLLFGGIGASGQEYKSPSSLHRRGRLLLGFAASSTLILFTLFLKQFM